MNVSARSRGGDALSTGAGRSGWPKLLVRSSFGRRVALLVLVAAVAAVPYLLSSSAAEVATVVGELSIVTIGLVALHGYAGQLSLGQAGFMAVTGYTMATLVSRYHWPALAALLIGIAACAVIAAVMGLALLRMRGLYLALATLAFANIVETVASGASNWTGGPSGEAVPAISIAGYTFDTLVRQYYLAWILTLFFGLLLWNFSRSPRGRAARAIGRDELMAGSLGIPVVRYKVTLFVLSAALAGLAGGLYAATLQFLSPDLVGVELSLQLFVMHVLGGVASMIGAVVGVAILQWIPQLAPSAQKYELIISGVVLLAVLRFLPIGLVPGVVQTARGLLGRRARRPEDRPVGAPEGDDSTSESSLSAEPAGTPPPSQCVAEDRGTSASAPAARPILELDGVTRSFAGLHALIDVTCTVSSGCITALIGPNGAGKTTLLNVITGAVRADHGRILFCGRDISGRMPHQVASAGIARTYQTPRIDASGTVLDNVLMGGCMQNRSSLVGALLRSSNYRRSERGVAAVARSWINMVGLSEWTDRPAAQLPLGHQRRLEIARALMQRPTLLVVDEPAAGSNDTERQFLAELFVTLRSMGQSVLLVEHNMDLVMSISQHVIVLDQGQVIASGAPSAVRSATSVIDAYLGHDRAYSGGIVPIEHIKSTRDPSRA